MQVTVLGKSPSWQDAGGACSGYLIQEGAHRLVVDCGNGVFAKLRAVGDYSEVDDVLITHMHADHFLDLVPFSYALLYGPRPPARKPRLLLPPDGCDLLRRIVGCWGSEDLIERAFAVAEYDPAAEPQAGPLLLRFCEVPHYIASYALEASGSSGRFVFGADCGPNDQLIGFARDSDLLMLEATLPSPEEEGERGHMTAREAGELARAAGARRLVLTHYTDELDPQRTRVEGAHGYGAPVEMARESVVFDI